MTDERLNEIRGWLRLECHLRGDQSFELLAYVGQLRGELAESERVRANLQETAQRFIDARNASEIARSKVVEALKLFIDRDLDWDMRHKESSMRALQKHRRTADDVLAAQPPNEVIKKLRKVLYLIEGVDYYDMYPDRSEGLLEAVPILNELIGDKKWK